MKTVFTSKELPHIWFHKSAPYGTAPSALSFTGDSILSYRTVMARHVTHAGKCGVILNSRSYSVTTTKHQSRIHEAIPAGTPLFWFDGEPPMGSETGSLLFDYAVKKSAECEASAKRSRSAEWSQEAATWLTRAGEVNAFFGLRRKVDASTVERVRKAAETAERKVLKARLAGEAKWKAEQEARVEAMRPDYEAWKNFAPGSYPAFNPSLFPVAFRIEEDELVSTLGARVPLTAARVALRFILRHRECGWHRNGETCPVGHYQLDAVNPQGVVAGCHRFTWEEVDRVSAIIG